MHDDQHNGHHPDVETALRHLGDAALPAIDHLRNAHLDAMVAAGETAQLDAAPVAATPEGKSPLLSRMYVKVGAGALAILVGTSGLAMAGVMPAPAQDALAKAAAKAGFTLPHSENAGKKDHTATTPTSTTSTTETTSTGDSTTTTPTTTKAHKDNHGGAVSTVAHDKSNKGRAHGQAVSEVASQNGQAHANENSSHNNSSNGNSGGSSSGKSGSTPPSHSSSGGKGHGKGKGHK